MFDHEYQCLKCQDIMLLVVLDEDGETVESRTNDFCESCGHEGLRPVDY